MGLPGAPWYLKETLDILYQIHSKISFFFFSLQDFWLRPFYELCTAVPHLPAEIPFWEVFLEGLFKKKSTIAVFCLWYSQIRRLWLLDCLRSPKYWSTWIFPLIHESVLLPVHWSFSPMMKCVTYSRVCFLFVFAMRIGEGKIDGQCTCSSGVWWCLCHCCFYCFHPPPWFYR